MNYFVWVLQGLLGLLFVFAGVMKFITPYEKMAAGMPVYLPKWFLLFIGVCELLGGIGLILPWLVRIRPGLTPLAAGLLAIIMAGAAVITAMGSPAMALFPAVVGVLLIFVAYKRAGEQRLG